MTGKKLRRLLNPFPTHVLLLLLTFVSDGPVSLANAQTGDAQAEQRYVDGLISRGLFSTASRFCETQQVQANGSAARVFWVRKQTEVRQQEAWLSASGGGRGGLIGLTIEEVDDALKQTPDAALQFQLQIRQLELTADAIRMSLQVGEGGHIFGRFSEIESPRPLLDPESAAVKTALRSTDAAIQQSAKLKQQLDQYRKRLGFRTAREIKQSLAVVSAELEVLKYRILRTTTAAANAQFEIANEQIRTSTAALSEKDLRQRLKWLHAELSLWSADVETTKLLIGSANAGDSRKSRPVQPLTARMYLFQQNTDAARRSLLAWKPTREVDRQTKNWLLLECHLGDFELAEQLQDDSLKAQAASAFALHVNQSDFVGVAADAAARSAQWFEMVRNTGRRTAVEIERIDQQSSSNPTIALQHIRALLKRLPTDRHRSLALLSFKAGRLLIQQKMWLESEKYLQDAVDHFVASGARSPQAEADLLRLFAIAQQIRMGADSGLQQRYLNGLKNHIASYGSLPTAQTASEWLSKLQSRTDPLIAVRTLLQSADNDALNSLKDLRDAAAILIPFESQNEQEQQLVNELIVELQTLFTDRLQSKDRYPLPQVRAAELDSLLLAARQANADDTTWLSIRDRLRQLRVTITDSESETIFRSQILSAAVIANTFSMSAEQEPLQTLLIKLRGRKAEFAKAFLTPIAMFGQPHDNRQWLAKSLIPMAQERIRASDPMEQRLDALRDLQRLAMVARQAKLYQAALMDVLNQPQSLSDKRLLADFMKKQMGTPQQLTDFWGGISKNEQKGSDLWLESQLQLALIAIDRGQKQQAAKRLKVVGAIYADWGSPERKKQVDGIIKSVDD